MTQRQTSGRLLASLIAGLFIPLGAHAQNADLMQQIETLNRQLEQLKGQVQANQQTTAELNETVQKNADKALDKWLTIGGDYQFRLDSLRGQSVPFTDVNATFTNAQNQLQAAFFADPSAANAAALSGLMGFAQGMAGVQTYAQAQAFLANAGNQQMMAGLGNFAQSIPAYKPRNDTLYSNRFGLDLHAKATQDVSLTARLLMYKTYGNPDDSALTNSGSAPFFADRVGVFDGTVGHVPSSNFLNVDRAFATWSNIAEQDMWFSVGRRPSTNGIPSHLRNNTARPGNGGTPALLVDYAFDGMTIGYAPDLEALPGAYGKICYGRGFESGFSKPLSNSLEDTDMVGVALVPIDSDPLRVWLQWNRGIDIFDAPKMSSTYYGATEPRTNLGDIDWFGVGVLGSVKSAGGGVLNYFAEAGASRSHPNNNVSAQFGFQGLLTGGFLAPEAPSDKTGRAVYVGLRYDLPSKTRIGVEYNHGSKDWITFAPAAGDAWTSKVGTRGDVYEAYLIQELDKKPIASRFARAFFRFGFQYYNFDYTGSNNWVGAPVKISDLGAASMQLTTPLDKAYNAYATFEVKF